MPDWIDIERTADEIILDLKIPRDIKKEEIKVEYREGWVRIRFPRRRGGAWETNPNRVNNIFMWLFTNLLLTLPMMAG